MMRKDSFFVFAVMMFLAGLSACRQQEEEPLTLELPSTPVLNVRSSWAVISSSHLRLRERPSVESSAVTTLWQNNVLEIISRDEKKQEVEGRSDFWYQVAYDGLQGWVFGAYLEMCESEAEARRIARSRREE
jgi:hypothetical protein